MSKALEALYRIKNTLLAEGYWQDALQDITVVEATLKKCETELKEKQERIEELEETNHLMFIREHKNEKKLKALEIIKKKTEYFTEFEDSTKTIYIDCALNCDNHEYDLLKEVLS